MGLVLKELGSGATGSELAGSTRLLVIGGATAVLFNKFTGSP